MKEKNGVGGFTLIEVLVALVVLAVALSALVEASGNYTHNAAYLQERTLAHWVAMNQVVEQQTTGKGAVEILKGEEEMAGRKWFWTVTISETPEPAVRRLNVAVFGNEGRTGSSLAHVEAYLAVL
ncbi:MAG: type II secretion system minor pseudopilin GspI [Magnetococcus sp. DMHC-6]